MPPTHFLVLAAAALAAPAFAQPAFGPFDDGRVLDPSPRFMGAGIELADVTGDGLLDAVVSDNYAQWPPYVRVINVLPNLGNGRWGAPVSTIPDTLTTDRFALTIALGDLNGDGRADLVTTYADSVFPTGNRPNLAVLSARPDGSFGDQINFPNSVIDQFMRGIYGRNVALGDMNGDGHLDIVSPASTNNFSVVPGNGDGMFGTPIQSGAGFATIMAVGDIDGDGDLDAAGFTNSGSDNRPFVDCYPNLNDGTGHFTAGTSFRVDLRLNGVGDGEGRAFLADVTGDGKADTIIFGERGSQSGAGGIRVHRSNGNGTFTQIFAESRSADSLRTASVVPADADGDGDIDIFKIPNGGVPGEIMLNDGSGGFAARTPLPTGDGYVTNGAVGDVGGSTLPDVVIYNDAYTSELPTSVRTALNLADPPAPGCDPDLNGDGNVDQDDVICIINVVAGSAGCTAQDPDFNRDGNVDQEDVGAVIGAVAGGGCP